MNEITRIHIAKTPYDIEVPAKKELEKYIKSLELYTQDADVLADIEIRITELLAEQGVVAGSVISSKDVAAVRTKLGEPYEFANDETDITVGPEATTTSRRFYRSLDDAVLGGVLSGLAAFLKINPLWVRLGFIIVLFVSFGFAAFVYLLLWIITPAARTATEKLQLAGKEVTVESIRALNVSQELTPRNKVAPVVQRILTIGLGTLSLIAAVVVATGTVGMVAASMTATENFNREISTFVGFNDNYWLVMSVFIIIIFGLLLLTALFSLIAYGFYARKATKRMIVSAIIITVLGIASATAAFGITASQSWRVASETRSMVRDTNVKLPSNFANVTSLNVTLDDENSRDEIRYPSVFPVVKYVVEEGPARYEFSALPTTKLAVNTEGSEATVALTIPKSYRNSFVQPTLTIYGPALQKVTSESLQFDYSGTTQAALQIQSKTGSSITVNGTYEKVEVSGEGMVDITSSAVAGLSVQSEKDLTVNAGTVRDLNVTQPEVCALTYSGYDSSNRVSVAGITSNTMTYNGKSLPAASNKTNCGEVIVGEPEINNSGY